MNHKLQGVPPFMELFTFRWLLYCHIFPNFSDSILKRTLCHFNRLLWFQLSFFMVRINPLYKLVFWVFWWIKRLLLSFWWGASDNFNYGRWYWLLRFNRPRVVLHAWFSDYSRRNNQGLKATWPWELVHEHVNWLLDWKGWSNHHVTLTKREFHSNNPYRYLSGTHER